MGEGGCTPPAVVEAEAAAGARTVLDEEVVQALVGEVDAELREAVEREVLEAEDVEDAGADGGVVHRDVVVDHDDVPVEAELVDVHDQRLLRPLRRPRLERHLVRREGGEGSDVGSDMGSDVG